MAPVAACALTVNEIIEKLGAPGTMSAQVKFEVLLPSAADPVTYDVSFTTVVPGDTLAPCDYLIDWTLPRKGKVSTGFSSYHAGDHFRYRDTRLQEYHVSDDMTPFTTSGGGVQRNAQFTEILPPFIAEKLLEMESDTTYHSEFDPKTGTLRGSRQINGYDALEYTYTFDPESGLPVQFDFLYNPAAISEQSVTVYYTWTEPETASPVFDEEYLLDRYGDIFEKFRVSGFRAESLRGEPLPAFSFDSPVGERVSHSRGENDLGAPALLVFLDAHVGSTEATVETVRDALSTLPMRVSAVYAFTDNDIPAGFELQDGEFRANSPSGLIRKCGITAYPTVLLVNSDGTVAEVLTGTGTEMSTSLPQLMMLLR